MNKTLPPGQARVLDCIKAFRAERGLSPTVRELQDFLGIKSPNGVVCSLKALEKKGAITRGDKTARSIQVVGENRSEKVLLADILDFIGVDGVVDERYTFKRDQLCKRICAVLGISSIE